jgi:RHS repeat-associated protein
VTQQAAYAAFGDGLFAPGGGSCCSLQAGMFDDAWQDSANNTYHTLNREYSPTQGRWLTPDPAGMAAVDPTNPQSWNRYAYALNNPVSFTDPLGLFVLGGGGGGSGDGSDDGGPNPFMAANLCFPGECLSNIMSLLNALPRFNLNRLGGLGFPQAAEGPAVNTFPNGTNLAAVGSSWIGNTWLTATAPIGRVADWVGNHPLITLPLAGFAALAGDEGPIEGDEAILEEGIPALEQGVTDKVTEAADAIEEWLGPGYRPFSSPTSDLALRSQDGTRMIRFDLTNPHGLAPHVNIQTWQPRNLFPGDTRMLPIDTLHVFLQP